MFTMGLKRCGCPGARFVVTSHVADPVNRHD